MQSWGVLGGHSTHYSSVFISLQSLYLYMAELQILSLGFTLGCESKGEVLLFTIHERHVKRVTFMHSTITWYSREQLAKHELFAMYSYKMPIVACDDDMMLNLSYAHALGIFNGPSPLLFSFLCVFILAFLSYLFHIFFICFSFVSFYLIFPTLRVPVINPYPRCVPL